MGETSGTANVPAVTTRLRAAYRFDYADPVEVEHGMDSLERGGTHGTDSI